MLHDENTSKEKVSNTIPSNINDEIRSGGAQITEKMLEHGQNKFKQIKSYSARYIEMLEKEVTEKPVQSVAIALGAGMALSFLLRRG